MLFKRRVLGDRAVIVHLVRHGTHAEVGGILSGRSEIPLSPIGQGEARAVAEAFAGTPVARLYSSPRRRTHETAAAIGAALGLPIETADALDEIDFGSFTGRDFVELDGNSDWRRWNAERGSARCPGGETMGEAIDRAAAFLGALPDIGTAICVSHCDVIRGLVCRALGLPFERMFALDCDTASVTTLSLHAHGMQLVQLNGRVPR